MGRNLAPALRLWTSLQSPSGRAQVFEVPAPRLPATPWSVGALLLAIGDAMAARFGAVAVRGELAGFSRASSGHCYFTLKDAQGAGAMLRCAMFRRAAALLDFPPSEGQQVEVRGRLAVYEARGELQFVVESMQRLGAGTLYEELLRLRARLEAQGLFDPDRKRSIEPWPRAVAVVTSLNAAALRDVLTTLQRRSPQVAAVVVPAPVQGVDAPPALVAALARAGGLAGVQTILLVRGGGALEDLRAFNDERVVRAVAASPLPVICGVGHETDFTLCDLAADLRAATPTAAAELAAPSRVDALEQLAARESGWRRALQRNLDRQGQRLDQLALRLSPVASLLGEQRQRLLALERRMAVALRAQVPARLQGVERLHARLSAAGLAQLRWLQARLDAQQMRLAANDPRQVLRRGYAWVEGDDGRPLLSAAASSVGQGITAVWADGSVHARVDSINPQAVDAAPKGAVAAGARPRRRSAPRRPT